VGVRGVLGVPLPLGADDGDDDGDVLGVASHVSFCGANGSLSVCLQPVPSTNAYPRECKYLHR
jgi:hypothetical protein